MTRRTQGNGPTAESSTDPRPRHIVLGTDGDGRHHHYISHTESIYVVDAGEVVHREDISTRHVDEWMAYVEDRVAGGWGERQYGNFFQKIADAVREAGA